MCTIERTASGEYYFDRNDRFPICRISFSVVSNRTAWMPFFLKIFLFSFMHRFLFDWFCTHCTFFLFRVLSNNPTKRYNKVAGRFEFEFGHQVLRTKNIEETTSYKASVYKCSSIKSNSLKSLYQRICTFLFATFVHLFVHTHMVLANL
jgi:hypothetical protein